MSTKNQNSTKKERIKIIEQTNNRKEGEEILSTVVIECHEEVIP